MAAKKTSKKSADKPKTFESFKAILMSKSKDALPKGMKYKLEGDDILFRVKGELAARIDVKEFAAGELKRHGFSAEG